MRKVLGLILGAGLLLAVSGCAGYAEYGYPDYPYDYDYPYYVYPSGPPYFYDRDRDDHERHEMRERQERHEEQEEHEWRR